MAHKTRVSGTNYEISGGKTMIGGTAYSIKNGKTLVDGTAYEVGFVKAPTITVYGNGEYVSNSNGYYAEAWIEHNGIKYYTPATFEANIGDIIYCYGNASNSTAYVRSPDFLFESTPYEYTVVGDAYIKLGLELYSDESTANIYISPVPDGGCAFFLDVPYVEKYFTAEGGMTWAEWYSSKYRYIYYSMQISGDYILVDYQGNALTLNGVFVKPTDVIVADATYSCAQKP